MRLRAFRVLFGNSGSERFAFVHNTWTHIAARAAVRPLVGTAVTPNHLTTLRLITGLAASLMLMLGTRAGDWAGGALWLVSAFLDRADGELARIGGMMSQAGHDYDYRVDVIVNSAFFLAIGVGLRHSWLGASAPPLGVVASLAILLCCWMAEVYERLSGPGVKTWTGKWGFDPDDALYLLGPFAWLGWLAPVLVGASIGASLVAAATAVRLFGLKRRLQAG